MKTSNLEVMEIAIPAGATSLPGTLELPYSAAGVAIFAHGSGSGRSSPRNRYVAESLHGRGVGTLLFDLLTEPEGADRRNVFDIDLLSERLLAAARWTMSHPATASMPIGLFGASTGGAAAMVVAAQEPMIRAAVSRGGRPDLAGAWLAQVRAPTLFIVGGEDHEVLKLNRNAFDEMRCEKKLEVVPDATHLFEEPGALEAVAQLAVEWFLFHFGAGDS